MAAFAVVFIMLGAMCVQASVTPPPHPVFSLPSMTTTAGQFNWATTNQAKILVGITLQYTDINGGLHQTGPGLPYCGFDSYDSYLAFCASNIFYGKMLVATNSSHPADPSAPARVVFSISYMNPVTFEQAPYTVSVIDSNAPSLNAITHDWLQGLTPRYLSMMLAVPNLEKLIIKVNDGTPAGYSNGWSVATSGSITARIQKPTILKQSSWEITDGWTSQFVQPKSVIGGHPPELTTSDWLVFNQWYLLESFRARFTIVISGQSKTFTELGNPIDQPATVIDKSDLSHIQVQWSPGADTLIRCSSDLINWSQVDQISGFGSPCSNKTESVPVGNSMFFWVTSE